MPRRAKPARCSGCGTATCGAKRLRFSSDACWSWAGGKRERRCPAYVVIEDGGIIHEGSLRSLRKWPWTARETRAWPRGMKRERAESHLPMAEGQGREMTGPEEVQGEASLAVPGPGLPGRR